MCIFVSSIGGEGEYPKRGETDGAIIVQLTAVMSAAAAAKDQNVGFDVECY